MQVVDSRNDRRNIADDELVGARVGKNIAAAVRNFFSVAFERVGLGVAEHAGHGDHFLRVVFRLAHVARGFGFLLDGVEGRDAQHVAVQLLVEAVVLQNDVERLIPGNFVENDGEGSLDVGVENDVEAADFVNQAEEVAQDRRPSG